MKKTKLTRSLLAACSIVALSAVMYGCTHSSGPSQDEYDATAAAAAAAKDQSAIDTEARMEAEDQSAIDTEARIEAEADAAAAALAQAAAEADAADAALAQAAAEADAADAALAQAAAEADAADAALAQAAAEADAADAADAQAAAEADAADAALAQAAAEADAADAADAQAAAEADAADAALAQAAAEADADAARLAQAAAEADADAARLAQADAEAAADAAADALAKAEAERDAALMALEENQQQMQDEEDADDIAKLKRLHRGLSNDDGDVAEGFDTPPGISATHGEPAESEAAPEDDDEVMTGGADEIARFSGTQNDWSDANFKNTQTIYTDIDETTGIPFGQVYDASLGYLEIMPDTADPNIAADGFVNVHRRAHDDNADGPDADTDPDHVAFEGTYQGAEGVYRCDDDDGAMTTTCTSTRDSDGDVRLSAGWTFTPNPGAMVKVTDGIYMYFGWWLRENLNAPANTGGLSVQTFFGVKDGDGDRIESTGIAALIGEATFEGAAVGKFAVYDPAATGGNAIIGGHFTADAKLTADFDTALAPGTIEGMIDNFILNGDAGPGDPWSVALMSTPLSDTAILGGMTAGGVNILGENANLHFDSTGDPFDHDGDEGLVTPALVDGGYGTQWSIGGRKEDRAGDWGGTFYDSTDGDADPSTPGRSDGTPGYAVGEFSAEYGTIGRMLGAFGTSNSEDDRDPQ